MPEAILGDKWRAAWCCQSSMVLPKLHDTSKIIMTPRASVKAAPARIMCIDAVSLLARLLMANALAGLRLLLQLLQLLLLLFLLLLRDHVVRDDVQMMDAVESQKPPISVHIHLFGEPNQRTRLVTSHMWVLTSSHCDLLDAGARG